MDLLDSDKFHRFKLILDGFHMVLIDFCNIWHPSKENEQNYQN